MQWERGGANRERSDARPLSGPDQLAFLRGGGQLGALIRDQDWRGSPLGEPAGWPQSLRSVVELLLNSQFPMFVAWGPELGLLYNDAYSEILGGKHPAALGRPFHDVWPEIWPELQSLIGAALRGEASYREDLRLVTNRRGRDEEGWFTFSYSPVRDESGAVAGMFCVCTEATARVRLEAELRESETRFRTAADGSPALMWMSDADGEITFANKRYRDFFGVDATEMLGSGWRRTVHPDEVDAFHQAFLEAVAERRPAHLQVRVLHPELGIRWLRCDGSPRFGADGTFLGYIGVNVDVTESVEAAQAVRSQEARFRHVTDAVPSFIWFAAPDGELQYLNSRWYEYTGQSPAEALPNGWASRLHPDDMERTALAWSSARETQTTYSIEIRYQRWDGSYRWYVARAEPVRDEAGRVTAWFGTSTDIHDRKLAEAALRESEARLRALTDHLPGGIVYQIAPAPDGSRRFSYVSQSIEDLLGLSADAVRADAGVAYNAIHPDDRAVVAAAEEKAIGSRVPFDVQVRFLRPDGEIRWFRLISAPRDQADGSTVWDGLQIDITSEKAAEAALIEKESSLRFAMEAGQMAEVTFDIQAGTIRHGAAFARLLGYPADHQLSLADLRDSYHPEDRDRVLAERAAILAADQEYYEVEKRIVRPDGQTRWLYGRGRVTRNASGEAHTVTALYFDETERKLAEAALHKTESQLRIIADALPVLISHMGPDLRYRFVNQAYEDWFGVSREEMLGRTVPEFIGPEAWARSEANIKRVLAGERVSIEQMMPYSRGGHRHVHMDLVPAVTSDGAPDGYYALIHDVSDARRAAEQLQQLAETLERRVRERTEELEQAHEQLRQSQKLEAMGQLTGGVAHDFNNLLTPIIGGLDLLQRRGLGNQRDQRLIAGALQSAERAKLLVQRLLAFARRQPLQPSPVDVGALITGMADLVASTSGPQIKVTVDLAPDLPPAQADPNQLEMAILNLSVNARDAMRDGGALTISARAETIGGERQPRLEPGSYVRLTIADTGSGMDEATLTRAIEPFFSTKGIGKGTGLGLSMVHGLASQLGGALFLSSRPGLGTSAELWLPVSREAAGQGGTEKVPAHDQNPSGTVLLVDDEPMVRESTAAMLGELGFDVVEAESAEAALVLLEGGLTIDLLVTDHLMPGLSGADLARRMRAARPALPVMIVSGYAEAEAIAPDLPRLVKPFRQDELAAKIAALRPAG